MKIKGIKSSKVAIKPRARILSGEPSMVLAGHANDTYSGAFVSPVTEDQSLWSHIFRVLRPGCHLLIVANPLQQMPAIEQFGFTVQHEAPEIVVATKPPATNIVIKSATTNGLLKAIIADGTIIVPVDHQGANVISAIDSGWPDVTGISNQSDINEIRRRVRRRLGHDT